MSNANERIEQINKVADRMLGHEDETLGKIVGIEVHNAAHKTNDMPSDLVTLDDLETTAEVLFIFTFSKTDFTLHLTPFITAHSSPEHVAGFLRDEIEGAGVPPDLKDAND